MLVTPRSRRSAMRRRFAISAWPRASVLSSSGVARDQQQRGVGLAFDFHRRVAKQLAVRLEETLRRGLDADAMAAGVERGLVRHELLSRQAPHDPEGIP